MAEPQEPGRSRKKKRKHVDRSLQGGHDVPEQSAGIKHILKRFRSAQTETTAASNSSEHDVKDAASGSVAAATNLGDSPGAAVAAAETIESGKAPDGSPAIAHQDAREELPASQSTGRTMEGRDAEQEDAPRQKKQPSEAVLPWMRLPVSIAPGQGVQLGGVGGLDPRLRDKLEAGTAFCPSTHIACNLGRQAEAWDSLQASATCGPDSVDLQSTDRAFREINLTLCHHAVSCRPPDTQHSCADGFAELYPVQVAAWRITAGGRSALHDVCISAPTGSGKTLAYALPIIQGLLGCAPRLVLMHSVHDCMLNLQDVCHIHHSWT